MQRFGLRSGPAPLFELPALDPADPPVRLVELRGRPLLINVFASTCAPCVKELPMIEEEHQRYRDRVGFLGIDQLDRRSAGVALVARTGVRFPVAFDEYGVVAEQWGLGGLPVTLFLDAAGNIAHRRIGPITRSETRRRLDSLLR